MQIQTIRLPGAKKIEVLSKELPDPQEGQVVVKTFQSSICGTDKNIYNGILPPGLKFPITLLGHEGGGTVAEVGKGVRKYKVGDRVMSKGLGADYVFDPNAPNSEKAIMDLTQGTGVDVVFEAAGTEASMNMATRILKKNGILVLYSWVMEPIHLHISRWHDDAINIRTTCVMHLNTPYERFAWFDRLLAPYWKGLIQVRPLLAGPVALKDISRGFELANQPDTIKVLIRPS